jgi:Trp operon repressor
MNIEWHHEQLLAVVKSLAGDKRALHGLMEILLTDKEYDGIARRLEILRALQGHESQRTIADRLHVSVATVTRMANMVKRDPERAIKIIQKVLTKR